MSKPDLIKAVLELQEALYYDRIELQFIKVDQLPRINGKEVKNICGIPLRTYLYEHEADVWLSMLTPDKEENPR